MRLEILNRSGQRLPHMALTLHVRRLRRLLQKEDPKLLAEDKDLLIVFVTTAEMKSLNAGFRKKDYATDILSFESEEPTGLGELVVCLDVLREQAHRHKHPLVDEAVYLLLHGILHLLGFNHEAGGRQAKTMYALQDRVFEAWRSTKATPAPKKMRSSRLKK